MRDWRDTAFSKRLGLRLPIIQGPFGGGLSSVQLAAEVSNAGALGSFGAHQLEPEEIIATAAAIRKRTDKPFALNLWLPFDGSDAPQASQSEIEHHLQALAPYFAELDAPLPQVPDRLSPVFEQQFEALLVARPAVFSFVYGVPSAEQLQRCREHGITTLGAATTVEEAIHLERAGVDMLVASGFEAGGHRVSFLRSPEDSLVGSISLVPQIVDQVRIPVIAAGGIADARGALAAQALGAAGVQIGTAFLACAESGTNDLHRHMLFSTHAKHTCLTRRFSGRLARGICNRLTEQQGSFSVAPYPLQNWLMGQLKQAAIKAQQPGLMSLWAGQSTPLLQHRRAQLLLDNIEHGVDQGYAH